MMHEVVAGEIDMKKRMTGFVLSAVALAIAVVALTAEAGMASAQAPAASPLLLPPQVEKDLAAKASNATEVTLNKDMLGFASKFMDGKDKDQAAVSNLIQGLDGIYVRDYEFDKEGEYSMEDIQKLRQAFETPEWTPMVRDVERKGAEINDVMVKMVNGETKGMFIFSAEPKETLHRADPREHPPRPAERVKGDWRPVRAGRRGEKHQGQRQGVRTSHKDKGGDQ